MSTQRPRAERVRETGKGAREDGAAVHQAGTAAGGGLGPRHRLRGFGHQVGVGATGVVVQGGGK